jgi:hypothetical protein
VNEEEKKAAVPAASIPMHPVVPPMIWRVPAGRMDPSDPNSMTCMEWASRLVESLENNSRLILPSGGPELYWPVDHQAEPEADTPQVIE